MKKTSLNDILVIIPAYNEEKKLGNVIDKVKKITNNILVVNDYSTDNTQAIIKSKQIKSINLISKLSYGAVVQTGFKWALARKYKYVALIDGDGQHDPEYLIDLYNNITDHNADFIIGSRFDLGYKMPFFKYLGSKLFSFIIRLITKKKFSDITSGYLMFNRKVLYFFCSDDYPIDYPDADVLLKLVLLKFNVLEVPVKMYNNYDKSMHNYVSSIYYIYKIMISIFIILIRRLINDST